MAVDESAAVTETAPPSILDALDILRRLRPVDKIVHVGCGSGRGAMNHWRDWAVSNVLIVEADVDRCAWLGAVLTDHPGWQLARAVLHAENGQGDFFIASNPSENGLVDPGLLRMFWPSMRAVESRRVATQQLDTLLDQLQLPWQPEWLLLECLPALPILQGAAKVLEHCGFIWARVVLDESTTHLDGARFSEIKEYLAPLAFRPIAVVEGLHPAVGEALFVRDWRVCLASRVQQFETAVSRLTLEGNEGHTRLAALMARNESLAVERDQLAEQSAGRRTRIELLASEIGELTAARDIQSNRVNELQAQLEARSKLTDKLEAQIEALARARDEQTKIIEEDRKQLDLLINENSSLNEALIRMTTAEEQAIHERTAVRHENQQLHFSQQIFDEEMIKAEAQIELIKDLLLRETGL